MLGVLDAIAAELPDAAARASQDAFSVWKFQYDINDELMVIRCTERLTDYHDFKRSNEGDCENDWTFIPDRVQAEGDAQEAAGELALVRLLIDHGDSKRGDIVETPKVEAVWMQQRHVAVAVTDAEAARWLDTPDFCAAPCISDRLRVADLLHGGTDGR